MFCASLSCWFIHEVNYLEGMFLYCYFYNDMTWEGKQLFQINIAVESFPVFSLSDYQPLKFGSNPSLFSAETLLQFEDLKSLHQKCSRICTAGLDLIQSYYQHPPILPPNTKNRLTGAIVLGKHRFIFLRGSSKRKDLCSVYKKKIMHFSESCKPVFSFNSLIPLKRVTQTAWEDSPFFQHWLIPEQSSPLSDGWDCHFHLCTLLFTFFLLQ